MYNRHSETIRDLDRPPSPKRGHILQDISWRVLDPPEKAELWEGGEFKVLAPEAMSEILFPSKVPLRVFDRYQQKEATIHVQGSLNAVLTTIHAFYKDMQEKYERYHEDDSDVDNDRYENENPDISGWYLGDGLWFEGMVVSEGSAVIVLGS